MATGENIEEPQKDKAADPEEHIQDIEIKDAKNVGEAGESVKNNEAVIIEEVVVEDKNKKKNEAETKENVVEAKRKEADQTEKKKDEVEKPDASERTNVEKSSSMAPGEKLEEAQKDNGVVGEVLKEEKKIEVEPREIVVDEKMKEAKMEVGLEEKKENGEVEIGGASESRGIEKCSSLREEKNFLSYLKEHEKRALMELRSKIEKAILEKKLLKENKDEVVENAVKAEQIEEKESGEVKKTMQNEGKGEENVVKEMEKEKETSKKVKEIEEKEEKKMENIEKGEENVVKEIEKEKEASKEVEEVEAAQPNKQEHEEKNKKAEEGQKENNKDVTKVDVNINKDIAIWGVPLLPSKGDNAVIFLKFLRAREFEVNDAFEMLRNTLQWRKDKNIDSILDEKFGDDLGSMSSMVGVGRLGHLVCYSVFKLLGDEELYNKVLGTEEKREMFVRSRVQLMERAIQKLDFKPGGVSSILLVNDLKGMPGPSRKELRNATKQLLALLQDNYPEFVARNIFINVPFWYYAFSASALLSPFLTPRTNSRFVFARPSRVTEVLLKYIASEELPVHYGGLRKENDTDFSTEDVVSEIFISQSSTECIQIPAPEAGITLMWEVIVLGWEVNYKEEFIPTHEGSYGIIVQRGRRIGVKEGSIRNSFTNNEPGNIVLTIENGALIKKKRICYRYKIKNRSSS